MNIRNIVLVAFSSLLLLGCKDAKSKAKLEKLGTYRVNACESSPFVWQGKLYYTESYYRDAGGPKAVIYDYFTDKPVSGDIATDCHFHSAAVVNDKLIVSCSSDWGGGAIFTYESTDLKKFTKRVILNAPKYGFYNTSLTQDDKGVYLMSLEVGKPTEEIGIPFTAKFAYSFDAIAWKLFPANMIFGQRKYIAPHKLLWSGKYGYLFYLEADTNRWVDGKVAYETKLARSRDLVTWEYSDKFLLRDTPDDKISFPGSSVDSNKLAHMLDINNSDIDFVEYNGSTYFTYCWGDQSGLHNSAKAKFHGTMQKFLEQFF